MLQLTDNTFWNVEGEDVVMFQTANGLIDGRKTFENRMSIDQFANLNAHIWELYEKPTEPQDDTAEDMALTINPEVAGSVGDFQAATEALVNAVLDEAEENEEFKAQIDAEMDALKDVEGFEPLESGTFDEPAEDKAE